MLYHLFAPLSQTNAVFNVFRYITFRSLAAAVTAFVVCFLIGPWFIRTMRLRQYGQEVRSDGPQSHLSKKGTPTMGGAFILIGIIGSTVLWSRLDQPYVWLVLAVTLGYGGLGFIDDFRKIRYKNTRGVSARMKLFWQAFIAAAALAIVYVWSAGDPDLALSTDIHVPFLKNFHPDLGVFYFPFAVFVIVAWGNAVNLTDGLDGLAIGPTILAAVTMGVLAYLAGHAMAASYLGIPKVAFSGELAVFCAAIFGAGLGFLWYNTYPAQVFMGDVGSLALGGALGAVSVATKNEVLSVIIGGVFVVEAISVIAQVTSFKLTGKRVLRMAPIHHHFELKGWAEPQVIVRFWIISVLLAILSLSSLKLR